MRHVWIGFLLLLGCGPTGTWGAADASGSADAAPADGATADGAVVDGAAVDASTVDAAPDLLAGFGELSGDCDVLDVELTAATPVRFESHFAFGRPYTDLDVGLLTAGGQEMIADGNLGGSSLLSEVFAFEALDRCERATLLKTETEIAYDTAGKKTDILVEIDGVPIGVSVTRAVGFPFEKPYPVQQATDLLEGKLADIALSSANVSAADRWQKQILVVLAYGPDHALALGAALDALDPAILGDTIVWIIVSDGSDDFIYCGGRCG